jgi:hypothetical protein
MSTMKTFDLIACLVGLKINPRESCSNETQLT